MSERLDPVLAAQELLAVEFLCDGCDEKIPIGEEESLWLATPLGITGVHVHHVRACAVEAKERMKTKVRFRDGDSLRYVNLGPARGTAPLVPNKPEADEGAEQ